MSFPKIRIHLSILFLFFISGIILAQNSPPEITAIGNQPYCPGTSINIATAVTIVDTDDTGTTAMYVQISTGYQFGVDTLSLTGTHPSITTVWNSSEGKIELNSSSGNAVLYDDFITAILDIQFNTTNTSTNTDRYFSITFGSANYLPSTDHYYEFVSDIGINWTSAKTAAENRIYYGLEGYLATIGSAEEAQLSGEQASGAGWIGGSDAAVEGVWRWVTGPEAGDNFWNGTFTGSAPPGAFEFWNTAEPNQAGDEDYTHVTAPGVGIPGSWNDLSNTGATSGSYQPKGYIVEYGGMPNDPILNLSASTSIHVPTISNSISNARCGTGTVDLEASSDFGVLNWYDASAINSVLFTGPIFTTPSINTTTTYFVTAAIDANCTTGVRIPITATVNSIPTIDSTTGDVICFNGTGNLQATSTTGSTINWYTTAVGGPSLGTGTTFNTPTVTSTTFYYVDASTSNCTTLSRTPVELTVYSPPAPTGDGVQTFCDLDNATITDLIIITGTNIKWYDALMGGSEFTDTEFLVDGQVYYASQNDGTCESIDRLLVEVILYETVVPTTITSLSECDNTSVGTDADGFILFDLTQKETELLNGSPVSDFTIFYFTDAGYSIPIPTPPSSFTNSISGGQTIYARIENSIDSTCYTDVSFEIVVFSLPVLDPTLAQPYELVQCDDITNNGLAFFNLSHPDIKQDFAPTHIADSFVFSYYTDPVEASIGSTVALIADPSNYENAASFVLETIWVRMENPNDCFRIATMTIDVTPSSAALAGYSPTALYQCDDGADNRDGIATFDLTDIHNHISNVIFPTINVTVHFFESQTEAELENNEIADIANHQNTNSLDVQDIWVRVKSDLGNNCLGLKEFSSFLNVEALPYAYSPTTLKVCDNDQDNSNPFSFITTNVEAEILNGQSLTDVTISYFNQDGSLIGTSLPDPFSTSSQTIDIVVTNNVSNDPDGACSDATTLEFIIDDLPEAFTPITDYTLCDDQPDPTDLISLFDTSTFESEILNGQTGMNVYYFDASGINPLLDSNGSTITSPFPLEFSTTTQTVTVMVVNPLNPTCPDTITVDFTVNQNPVFDLIQEDMVCENILPHSISVENPDQNDYLYQWYDDSGTAIPDPEGTSQILLISNTDGISESGATYSVTVTNPTTGCNTNKNIQLWKSSNAIVTEADIRTDEFSSPYNSIEIITTSLGSGDYEFSLEHESDYRYPQDDPLFIGLMGGIYTLIVNDKNGCGQSIPLEIVLLDYPKFFTPNNDDENDTWKLVGLDSKSFDISPIQVFDRFGKVVAVLDPNSDGWDGYYKGAALPSSDYWFSLQLTDIHGNTKIHRGHFSLVRR